MRHKRSKEMLNNNLPDNAKVWVYQSTRPFTMAEAITIRKHINSFVDQWTSHKAGVTGWGDLLHNRFVILMADESEVKPSGCSIDSSVRFVKGLEQEMKTQFFDRWNIAYIKNNEVLSCNKEELCKLVESGEINDDTVVFNNLVQNKAELLNNWQIPYSQSWLKRVASANTSFNSVL